MHKRIWCRRDILVTPYYFTIALDEESYYAELKKLGIHVSLWGDFVGERSDATCHFYNNSKLNKDICIVCIKGWEKRDPIDLVGLLIHEAVHIFQATCSSIGETSPSSEMEAYSIQLISMELMDKFSLARQEIQSKAKAAKSRRKPVKLTQGRSPKK